MYRLKLSEMTRILYQWKNSSQLAESVIKTFDSPKLNTVIDTHFPQPCLYSYFETLEKIY